MTQPLVTVICLCHNHALFVREAIESVLKQTYKNIQLVVVDDASSDGSEAVIKKTIKESQGIQFISLPKNQGNCKAFNQGLKKARGQFVIDLAADDVLLPERVGTGVNEFLKRDDTFGVQFSDAELIDEKGSRLGFHSDRFPHQSIPEGDVYRDLIRRYFINSPTMMIRKPVLDKLNGYDENLYYEDFDFWIRSARLYKYLYVPQALIKRRIVRGSMSESQFKRSSPQQESTFQVCKKIMSLNKNRLEQEALNHRIFYEMFQCVKRFDFALLLKYANLGRTNSLIKF